MTTKITIIGAGPGGYAAAIRAAGLGADVTVIEKESLGGTCLNRGCIPSKILKTSAEILEKFHRAKDFGIKTDGRALVDMRRLMIRKETVIQNQANGMLKQFKDKKIRFIKGSAHIAGSNLVTVIRDDGEMIEVIWDKLILALGSVPLDNEIFPFDGRKILSSREALNLYDVPKSILIVGGGVIGCELASIFKSFGSEVTLVETMSRLLPLPSVDEGCVKILMREMKKSKIGVLLNQTVERVEKVEDKLRVGIGPSVSVCEAEGKSIESSIIEAERLLVCIGRKPCTDGIGLEKLGVKMDKKGWIVADKRMRTNISDIYAIGDILGPGKVMLAHVASTEGVVAAENAMGKERIMDYNVIPNAIFTMPEIANVGLTEVQAKELNCNIRSDVVLFRSLGKAHVIGEIAGEAKIVSDAASGRILGVHIVGPLATELIAEGTLAVQMETCVKDLAKTIHAHPTLAEIMLEAALIER